MIRLTIKGETKSVLAELHRRNIAPFALEERVSQFVPGLVTCDVAVTSNHRAAVGLWFDEGDELLGKGQGFPDGALMYFSAPNEESEGQGK